MRRKITFVEKKVPSSYDPEDLIDWILSSLGLVLKKDQKEGIKEVFKEILRISKEKEYFTIDDIASKVKLSRTTAYHHITKMVNSGIIIRTRKGYTLTSHTLEGCIIEIEHETQRILERIKRISRELDRLLDDSFH